MFKLSAYNDEKLDMINFSKILSYIAISWAICAQSNTYGSDEKRAELIEKDLQSLTEIILDTDEDDIDFYDQKKIINLQNSSINDIYNLRKAKFKLINGDLRLAEFFLNRLDDRTTKLISIKKRYQGIISFLKGDYEISLNHLSHPKVYNSHFAEEICLLRIMNMIILNKMDTLQSENRACRALTANTSKNDQYWLNTLIGLKLSNDKYSENVKNLNIHNIFAYTDISRIWLKTGLYLNQEKDVIKLLSNLDPEAYESRPLREVVAFIYYRLNQDANALKFIDNIDSANAENIRGNIRLKNNEYEIAFGHFKLALQRKSDSQNALERALPLSWILGQWDDGLKMLDYVNINYDQRNKNALKIAFLIRKGAFQEAHKELRALTNQYLDNPPFEVHLMNAYVNLVIEKDFPNKIVIEERRKTEDSVENSCRDYDGMSCWLAMQYLQWENLGKTIHRNDPIYDDKEMTIESLKQRVAIVPLDEEINVNQSDVEELDGSIINILPSVNRE